MIKLKLVNSEAQIYEVAGLACKIWNECFPVIIGQAQVDYMVDKFQSTQALAKQIDSGYQYYLIQSDDNSIGYIGLVFDSEKSRLQLSKFYILKEKRAKGIGRVVLKQIIELVEKQAFNKIWLTVNKNNISAIKAYQRMGFAIVENIVLDIGEGYVMDDFKMEKSLP